jgi:hypothetical protein
MPGYGGDNLGHNHCAPWPLSMAMTRWQGKLSERRMQSYWALLGMVGYSLTTLFTKLAERSGEVSS